jgi:import receptor subunit TOM20
MPTTQQIVVGSLAVLATSAVGYAAYFDYRRRNDPEFRKKLSESSRRAFNGY